MMFDHPIRRSRKAGLHAQPERVCRHHPDFDRQASQGWKALEAKAQLSDKGWRKEQQWALDMGLPGAECLTARFVEGALKEAGFAVERTETMLEGITSTTRARKP